MKDTDTEPMFQFKGLDGKWYDARCPTFRSDIEYRQVPSKTKKVLSRLKSFEQFCEQINEDLEIMQSAYERIMDRATLFNGKYDFTDEANKIVGDMF